MTTAARIIEMLVNDFRVDPHMLTPDARLEDIGVDSIGVAELLFNIEDEFHLKLPDVPMTLVTFGNVIRYVDEQIAAQDASTPVSKYIANDSPLSS